MVVRIELLDAEIAWTDENVAEKRYENAIVQQRTPGNAGPPPNLDIDILGARCEAAAYKWMRPVRWSWQHRGREHIPDLHDFIDVKGVANPTYNLMVKPNDPQRWAYLLLDGSAHPFYDVIGWCWGFEAYTLPLTSRKAGRWNYFVDRDNPMLKDPALLLLVLRERQQFPERSRAAVTQPVVP